MNTRLISINSPEFPNKTAKPSVRDKLARRLVLARLQHIQAGQIVISENGTHTTYGELTEEFPLTAQLRVHDPRFYSDIAFGGSIGAGEAFMKGRWSCDELVDLLRIFLRCPAMMMRALFLLPTPDHPADRV